MALASALGFKVSVNNETVWGTPVGAGGAYCRVTGGIGKTTTQSNASKEMTRFEVADVYRTRVQAGGAYNFEWSYSTADKELDAIIGSLFGNVWTTNVIKVNSLSKPLTVEEVYSDITKVIHYDGAFVNSLTMNASVGDAVTGSWGFVSKAGVSAGTAVNTTPAAANSNPVMNPIDALQTLTWSGSAIVSPTAFTMDLKRTTIEFPVMNSISPANLAPGSFEASGSFSCYVPDHIYLADYLAFTEAALAITVGGAGSKKYAFLFSKVRLTDGGMVGGGQNQPFIQTFNWMAKADDAGTSTCQITRTP
jgi:hypothetical protein